MTHLGDRIAALVDGELGHQDRDRALAHVAHCARCRQELDEQRSVRALLAGSAAPVPSAETVEALLSLATPGGPLPPRARTMPQGPIVPELPPPGRFGRTGPRGSRDPQRAANRADSRRPGDPAARRQRSAGRGRLVAASALSVAGLVLGTAFVAGGAESGGGPVVPPVAQLTVEHGRTATAVTVGDPAFGLTAGLTGFPAGAGEPTVSGR